MAKDLKHGTDARVAMAAGINKLADTVKKIQLRSHWVPRAGT